MWRYDKADVNQNDIDEMTALCESEETEDIGLLRAYYRLRSMQLVCPVLEHLEERHRTCSESELGKINQLRKQIFTAIKEFDNAISEFAYHDRDDDYECIDEVYDEEVLFDKIKNLASSYKYYCEELRRIKADVQC